MFVKQLSKVNVSCWLRQKLHWPGLDDPAILPESSRRGPTYCYALYWYLLMVHYRERDLLYTCLFRGPLQCVLHFAENPETQASNCLTYRLTGVFFFPFFLSSYSSFVFIISSINLSCIYIYPGIFFIALAFGILFDIIIWDIEHIEGSTHIYPTVFLTAIALINIYIMTLLNNQLASFLLLESHSPIAVALVYVIGFMLPYIYKRGRKISKTPKSSWIGNLISFQKLYK